MAQSDVRSNQTEAPTPCRRWKAEIHRPGHIRARWAGRPCSGTVPGLWPMAAQTAGIWASRQMVQGGSAIHGVAWGTAQRAGGSWLETDDLSSLPRPTSRPWSCLRKEPWTEGQTEPGNATAHTHTCTHKHTHVSNWASRASDLTSPCAVSRSLCAHSKPWTSEEGAEHVLCFLFSAWP